jgi:hypothetical protein
MDDAAKGAKDAAKDAAKKVSNFFKNIGPSKKFSGTGHKLGSAAPSTGAVCNQLLCCRILKL